MRVILDTNVLVSGLMPADRAPRRLLDGWHGRAYILVSHRLQLDELRDVSRRGKMKRLLRRHEVGRLINEIASIADMPERLPRVSRSRDPGDDFLLALCEAGEADRLATGDKAGLLALKRHGPTAIVTAAAFAAFAAELGLYSPAR